MLPAEPASAAAARRALREVLADAEREDCTDVAELACTELVTNAVLHAHTPIELTIEITDAVRVEVRDYSSARPALRGYDSSATTGRGLALVAAVTDHHGVVDAGHAGKTVWFSLGGEDERRTDAELLAAWDVEGWAEEVVQDLEAAGVVGPEPEPTGTVRFRGLPAVLWLAAREHHDALLRELVLYLARHPLPGVDLLATDQARGAMSGPVMAAIAEAQRGDGSRAPDADAVPHLAPVPETVDVEVSIPLRLGPAFGLMQDTLDAAEALAQDGRLLARPGLPEVVALRDWLCEQVVAQLADVPASPWPGLDHERFVAQGTQGARAEAAELDVVRGSARAVVAADESNRVVAVSPRLAELTGWAVEDLVGRRVNALVPPRLREAHVAGFTRHQTTGEVRMLGRPVVLPVLHRDGSEVEYDVVIEEAPGLRRHPLYLAWFEPVHPVGPSTLVAAGTAGVPDAPPSSAVDYVRLFRTLPTPYLVMTPDLVIVDCDDAYLATVGRTRADIIGRPVFEAFPPAADALDEDGVPRIQRSFERARDTGRPHTMPIQKYDIPDLARGGMTERYWSLISIPVLDAEGRTVLVAQRAEDITDFVREREARQADRRLGEQWRRRVVEVEADLYARARELTAALEEKDVAARRLASLAEAAALLTSAETVADLEQIIVGRGLPVLGADGGAVVTPDGDGGWRSFLSATLAGEVTVQHGREPADSPMPGVWCARTGHRLLLPTRAAGLAFHPVMEQVHAGTGRSGWAFVPLKVNERVIGSLGVAWTEEHQTTSDELAIIDAFAAQLAQALDRIQATAAQRAAAAEAQRMSETLQRSLLTQPPRLEGLQIAVRYQPAARQAEVGGDWYDAFTTTTGGTVLVVGDVNGHDRTAAAIMGQVRNLLRGLAYDSTDGPALLLTRLDVAMAGLQIDTLVTAVLARVETTSSDRARGVRRVRWANAGHLPPVLRRPDGRVEVLDRRTDLLLGLDPTTLRRERAVEITEGSTLVLYTDGLVERRRAHLDEGIGRLVDVVERHGHGAPEELADAILAEIGAESREDDLALLVLRAGA